MQRYYSRIYWHFTGSPKGDVQVLSPDELLKRSKPKTEKESVEILLKILKSQRLKATSQEQVGLYKTSAFCSTTDIPFKDLVEHAVYYGRAAIGFKAEAVHDVFLPVCYVSSVHESKDNLLREEHPLMDFIKITDFHPREGHTFYREREWRNIGDFVFEKKEIAAIVVPDDALKMVRTFLEGQGYPEDISVLSWRLIEEA
ncbi:abortive infection system antitoxin AbiGi family protein [Pseudalkalibacillus salsuginis]|uniref:abortive infection system antitoxin AbiGi family protein n=1 Tax=Pseudalkalibacillus salsuginis TaxID=2910972 RepID=UPI001F221867|nr:abortive infection system antitoxin AbiGi family protein [Pseudalkalibacillus salsuginis]MCF6412086.1 abortive infection system antitoxin AbiGi family protein [Pseudalkalibacillus salsuginis]